MENSISYYRGAKAMKVKVLKILRENAKVCKTLTKEDAARSAQDIVNETYLDLISIIKTL